MKPGIELDKLIAEKVMGISELDALGLYKPYSTDISAAWKVVEKLTSEKWISINVINRPKHADNGEAWTTGRKVMIEIVYGGHGVDGPPTRIIGSFAPHAICLAILELEKYEAVTDWHQGITVIQALGEEEV